ncbi:MAG: hypothetical protein M1838_001888 [Thelocarpon superellum]|nr:MAG: hypothetical protein M1838_001888 [Thelocarpon superellum]
MPLLEVVPSVHTSPGVVDATVAYWRERGRAPAVLQKECLGFVAIRLAFALLRESVHLVSAGVIGVADLDALVTSSVGPRWAVNPFKSYHQSGGARGWRALLDNIGGTVHACWDDAGRKEVGQCWEETVVAQTNQAYGRVTPAALAERDCLTMSILHIVQDEKSTTSADVNNDVTLRASNLE